MAEYSVLSEDDRRVIRQLLTDYRRGRLNVQGKSQPEKVSQAAKVYVAKVEVGGIMARSGLTPGTGAVTLYRVGDDGVMESMAITQTVYNISQYDAVAGDYLLATQERGGKWIVKADCCLAVAEDECGNLLLDCDDVEPGTGTGTGTTTTETFDFPCGADPMDQFPVPGDLIATFTLGVYTLSLRLTYITAEDGNTNCGGQAGWVWGDGVDFLDLCDDVQIGGVAFCCDGSISIVTKEFGIQQAYTQPFGIEETTTVSDSPPVHFFTQTTSNYNYCGYTETEKLQLDIVAP